MEDSVSAAFAATPRAGFLPRLSRGRAAYDGPIQIGRGQTNSQPRTVEAMLRLLAVRAGDRVLVSAEPRHLPQELVDQVAAGGRMVIPVDGVMLLVDHTEGGIEVSEHGGYRFVPLR